MEHLGGARSGVGYRSMRPVDQPTGPALGGGSVALPDLLGVADAESARQSLTAARAVVLLDRRGLVLSVLGRALVAAAVTLWFSALDLGDDAEFRYVLAALVLYVVVGTVDDRLPVLRGAQPRFLGRSWPVVVGRGRCGSRPMSATSASSGP